MGKRAGPVVCALLGLVVASACAPVPGSERTLATPPPSPAAPVPSDVVSASPPPGASVTEAPISPSPGPSVLSDMRTNALGPLLGHWVFVAKLVRGPMQGRLEMWAIPLDAGQPR